MRNYESGFKEKIIRLHLEEGQTIRALADEYNISKSSISDWVKNYRAECQTNHEAKEEYDYMTENRKLRKELEEMEKENLFLKKAAAFFAKGIERNKSFIKGLETDMATLEAHPHPKDGFAGMVVRGDSLTDKDNAGAAILEACKEVKGLEPMEIGGYRGFTMSLSVDVNAGKEMMETPDEI